MVNRINICLNVLKVFAYGAFGVLVWGEFVTTDIVETYNNQESVEKISFSLSKEVVWVTIALAVLEALSNFININPSKK